LNIHGVNDVRQTGVHTVQPLVSGPTSFWIGVTIEKLKRYKSPGTVQIPAELIQAGGTTLPSEIHELVNSIWNKEELPQLWEKFIIVSVYKKR